MSNICLSLKSFIKYHIVIKPARTNLLTLQSLGQGDAPAVKGTVAQAGGAESGSPELIQMADT